MNVMTTGIVILAPIALAIRRRAEPGLHWIAGVNLFPLEPEAPARSRRVGA